MILGNEKGKSVNIEMLQDEIRLSGSRRTITDGLQQDYEFRKWRYYTAEENREKDEMYEGYDWE